MTVVSSARQASLPGMCPVTAAVAELAAAGIEHRGAIYTKREVVEFILDLAGLGRRSVICRAWRCFP